MRIAFVHPRYPAAEGTGAVHDATQIVTGLCEARHERARGTFSLERCAREYFGLYEAVEVGNSEELGVMWRDKET